MLTIVRLPAMRRARLRISSAVQPASGAAQSQLLAWPSRVPRTYSAKRSNPFVQRATKPRS